MNDLIKKRWEEFNAEHADYESSVIGHVLGAFGQGYLVSMFGWEVAESGMRGIYQALGIDFEGLHPLFSGPDLTIEELKKFRIYSGVVALRAYADYGLPVAFDEFGSAPLDAHDIPEKAEERAQHIKALIDNCSEVESTYGFFAGTEVERTLKAAKARWAIDTGDHNSSVLPEELAALAGVSVKSIRNLLAPDNESGLHALNDRSVPVPEARSWLKSRSGFRSSVWQIEEYTVAREKHPDPTQEPLEAVVFVPMAKDGSWFSPEHNRSGKYRVGPKENEQALEDYMEALNVLNCMDPPMWRRPSAKGQWGIVAGVAWTRKTTAELGL